jgi:hypothetical protein
VRGFERWRKNTRRQRRQSPATWKSDISWHPPERQHLRVGRQRCKPDPATLVDDKIMPWSEAELCEAAHIRLVKSASYHDRRSLVRARAFPTGWWFPLICPLSLWAEMWLTKAAIFILNHCPEAGGFG